MAIPDQTARYTVKLEPGGCLRWLLEGVEPPLTFTRWLETQTIPFPGEPDRRCDTVAEMVPADGLGPPWAVVVEVQTRPDPDMPERLLEYMARLRRELRHGPHGRDRYPVAGVLVTLTGSGPAELNMVLPGPAGLGMRWRLGGRVLAAEDAGQTLVRIETGQLSAGLLPWVPLMGGAGEAAVRDTWRRLAAAEPDHRRRGNYGALARFFAELTDWEEAWRQLLEDWNMEESRFLSEWTAKVLEKDRAETSRSMLRRLLQSKFPGPWPPEVSGAIEAQTDSTELSRWFDLAIAATSLEQFQAGLSVPPGQSNGTGSPKA
jgi:hypothetical protein